MTCHPFCVAGLQRRKYPPEILPRPMQSRFDGSDFRLHNSRDFLQRQIFVLGKDQNFALKGRQRANSLSDDLRGLPHTYVYRLSDKVLVFQFFPSALASPSLEREISCHSQQKRPKRPSGSIEGIRTIQQRNKDILGDVGCRFGRTGHPPCETVDGVVVLHEDGFEFRVSHSSIVTPERRKDTGSSGKCYWDTLVPHLVPEQKVWVLWTMQTEWMIFSLVRIKI